MLPAQDRCFTMIRTHSITTEQASIMAVAALDDLVNDLVKASCLHMSPAFLDWVADEATPLVERSIARSFHSPKFAHSLQMGDPRIALARWVRHWVCPWIVVNFESLAAYLPEFADSRPAGLMEPARGATAMAARSSVRERSHLPQMAMAA